MRIVSFAAAASLALVSLPLAAGAATPSDGIATRSAGQLTDVDYYAFAGGRDAAVAAPLQAGRSAAGTAPKAFSRDDVNHAFAPCAFAD